MFSSAEPFPTSDEKILISRLATLNIKMNQLSDKPTLYPKLATLNIYKGELNNQHLSNGQALVLRSRFRERLWIDCEMSLQCGIERMRNVVVNTGRGSLELL